MTEVEPPTRTAEYPRRESAPRLPCGDALPAGFMRITLAEYLEG